jgi:hypothetical protein
VGALVQPAPSSQGLGPGHRAGVAHEPAPPQLALQAHESEQSMPPPQADWPPHWMSQAPAPQVSGPPQALDWLQEIVHAVAAEQSTPVPQAERPQLTRQGMPGGHTTLAPQDESPLQSITQPPPSQRVQTAGQTKASPGAPSTAPGPPSPTVLGSTQKPPEQTRPSWHSSVVTQV